MKSILKLLMCMLVAFVSTVSMAACEVNSLEKADVLVVGEEISTESVFTLTAIPAMEYCYTVDPPSYIQAATVIDTHSAYTSREAKKWVRCNKNGSFGISGTNKRVLPRGSIEPPEHIKQ